jgi:hypothetical protein
VVLFGSKVNIALRVKMSLAVEGFGRGRRSEPEREDLHGAARAAVGAVFDRRTWIKPWLGTAE